MGTNKELILSDYDISFERGFLPHNDPLAQLPKELAFIDELGNNLPELIRTGKVNDEARGLLTLSESISYLSRQELQLLWVRYAFIQSACVHSQKHDNQSFKVICRNVALPIFQISKLLDKLPILSYDAYTLYNWKKKDLKEGITVGNTELIQTFMDDPEQAWFILIHVDIESKAGLAINNLRTAVLAAENGDYMDMECGLSGIEISLDNMIDTMLRMPEGTSPDTYYKIRPWIMSFENVVYEGVEEFRYEPRSFRGQTGAQTSIFQSLEAGLQMPGLEENKLAVHLKDMRNYMPKGHREFIKELESRSKVRDFVKDYPSLTERYDRCVQLALAFLSIHFGYAFYYIFKQTSNPKGTGGTDFMDYLEGRIKERWMRAFIRPRTEDDFKLFMNKVRELVNQVLDL